MTTFKVTIRNEDLLIHLKQVSLFGLKGEKRGVEILTFVELLDSSDQVTIILSPTGEGAIWWHWDFMN
jgi:hypothetical protein